jgi:hypothetical protein
VPCATRPRSPSRPADFPWVQGYCSKRRPSSPRRVRGPPIPSSHTSPVSADRSGCADRVRKRRSTAQQNAEKDSTSPSPSTHWRFSTTVWVDTPEAYAAAASGCPLRRCEHRQLPAGRARRCRRPVRGDGGSQRRTAQLVERAAASGTDTALGMAARSMALVTNGATADALMPRTARPSRTCSAAPSPSIWHAPTWSTANGCVA